MPTCILVHFSRRPETKRLREPGRKFQDNIKMNLKWGVKRELDLTGSGWRSVDGFWRHNIEPSVILKGENFLPS